MCGHRTFCIKNVVSSDLEIEHFFDEGKKQNNFSDALNIQNRIKKCS